MCKRYYTWIKICTERQTTFYLDKRNIFSWNGLCISSLAEVSILRVYKYSTCILRV